MKEKEERCSAAIETQVIRVSTRKIEGEEIEKYCLGAHWGLV